MGTESQVIEKDAAPGWRQKNWRNWTRFDWSEALLDHYFSASDLGQPVRSITAVPEELTRCARDPEATASEIEADFFRKIINSVGPGKSVWAKATDGGKGRPPENYLAFLIASCLAVTEIDIDNAIEDGNIARFATRFRPARGDDNLEKLAQLWEELREWLRVNPGYRKLELPDPGGWTRIGYTVKLAFPSRRDRDALSWLLSSSDLGFENPPVRDVISLVETAKSGTFSNRFYEHFRDFKEERTTQARSNSASTSGLYTSPFWTAVRTAVQQSGDQDRTGGARWALLAFSEPSTADQHFEFSFDLVGNAQASTAAFRMDLLDEPCGEWIHRASSFGSDGQGNPELDPVESVLNQVVHLGDVSRLAKQGVIPFIEGMHGEFESTGRQEDIEFTSAALVRTSLSNAVRTRFGTRATRIYPTQLSGWEFIHGLSLRVTDDGSLGGTELEHCSIFNAGVTRDSIRLINGIKVGNDYLGLCGTLPLVSAPGAASVSAIISGDSIRLVEQTPGAWSLPDQQLNGVLTISATFPTHDLSKSFAFVGAPATERYRFPNDPSAFMFEHLASSLSLTERLSMFASSPQRIEVRDLVYLGRDVGVFLPTMDGAAWQVDPESQFLEPLMSLDQIGPTGEVNDAGLCRKWRRILQKHSASCGAQARSAARSAVNANPKPFADRLVPVVDGAPGIKVPIMRPHRDLHRVVERVAALANNGTIFRRIQLAEVMKSTFGLSDAVAYATLQAWREAELVDELANVRWSGGRFIAVRPHLQVFTTAIDVRAVVSGLVLPTTFVDIERIARAHDVRVLETGSVSPFVPSTVELRSAELVSIKSVGEIAGLPLRFLASSPFHGARPRDGLTPVWHESFTAGHTEVIGSGGVIKQYWRKGSPSLWTVSAGGHTTWRFSRGAAQFWAYAASRAFNATLLNSNGFTFMDCHIPLGAARWLATTSSIRPGPVDHIPSSPYVYAASSNTTRLHFLDELKEFIERELDAADGVNTKERTNA